MIISQTTYGLVVTEADQRYFMLNNIRFKLLDENQFFIINKNSFSRADDLQIILEFSKSTVFMYPISEKYIPKSIKLLLSKGDQVYKIAIAKEDSSQTRIELFDKREHLVRFRLSTLFAYEKKIEKAEKEGVKLKLPPEKILTEKNLLEKLKNK